MTRAAILAFLLTGCASDMVRLANVHTTTITWIAQAPVVCGGYDTRKGDVTIHGCAQVSPDQQRCTVMMAENAPDWVVAHEFKHCFGWRNGQ